MQHQALSRDDREAHGVEAPVVAVREQVVDEAKKAWNDVQVVVVVFDELPTTSLLDENGDIDAIRYPSFARLARTSTWFRRASGVHALSEHAIPAVLTGRYPDPDLLPIASDHPRNLFTLLSGSLEMHVEEPFTSLYRPATEDAIAQRIARARGLISDLSVVYLHVLLPREWATAVPPVTRAARPATRTPRHPACGSGARSRF